jgi:hypothetical protein
LLTTPNELRVVEVVLRPLLDCCLYSLYSRTLFTSRFLSTEITYNLEKILLLLTTPNKLRVVEVVSRPLLDSCLYRLFSHTLFTSKLLKGMEIIDNLETVLLLLAIS